MGLGNFWQGMVGSPVGQWAKGVDTGFANRAVAGEAAARDAGIGRNREAAMNMNREQLLNRLSTEAGLGQGELDAYGKRYDSVMKRPEAQRQKHMGLLADDVAPQLNRGPAGIGKMGLMERLSSQAANNRYVRRGAYPALIAGGTVAGGAALTEGAQQLMALMAYMNESEQTAQRTEQSPLASQQA